MFCGQCGNENRNDRKFCSECGAKLKDYTENVEKKQLVLVEHVEQKKDKVVKIQKTTKAMLWLLIITTIILTACIFLTKGRIRTILFYFLYNSRKSIVVRSQRVLRNELLTLWLFFFYRLFVFLLNYYKLC